jgi:hypothetical protein
MAASHLGSHIVTTASGAEEVMTEFTMTIDGQAVTA